MSVVFHILAAVAAVAGALPPAEPDLGGVTFDFRKVSDARFRIPLPGDSGNLIDDTPWRGGEYCRLHHVKARFDAARQAAVAKTVRWHQADGVCHVEKPSALRAAAGTFEGEPLAANVSGAFTKFVELPDDDDGVRYTNRGGTRTWSAAELRAGVTLMVGAARTKAFFIRPADRADGAVAEMTAERLAALLRARRPALAAAAAADARDERANVVTADGTAEL